MDRNYENLLDKITGKLDEIKVDRKISSNDNADGGAWGQDSNETKAKPSEAQANDRNAAPNQAEEKKGNAWGSEPASNN